MSSWSGLTLLLACWTASSQQPSHPGLVDQQGKLRLPGRTAEIFVFDRPAGKQPPYRYSRR